MMTESILNALLGGVLIGFSVSLTLLFSGRIAGISNILGGLVSGIRPAASWRTSFLVGLVAGGVAIQFTAPQFIQDPVNSSTVVLAIAGVLVGFGTQMSRGCTSGHGVAGLSRLSKRSLVATLTFMITGAASATALAFLTGANS